MSPSNSSPNDGDDAALQEEQHEEEPQLEEEEDEEAAEERRRQKKKDKKRKKKNKKKRKAEDDLPTEQTEEERREIRRKQRLVNTEIDQSTSLENVQKGRESNNEIFKSVGHAREAVLDAENVGKVADKFHEHAEQLVQVPRYDALKLVQKLRNKCAVQGNGSSSFNWLMLGRESGICFNSVPDRCRFLAGPLEADRPAAKVRAKPVRTQRQRMADVKEVRPEEIVDQKANASVDNDKASAAERAMKAMAKKLKKRVNEEGEDGKYGIDAIQFLFNPKSFTQTVENIFNYSFLIKKGDAEIGVRSKLEAAEHGGKPGLYVRPMKHDADRQATQAVLSFTMQDWRRLKAAYDVKECDLGHRRTKIKKGGPITSQMCD